MTQADRDQSTNQLIEESEVLRDQLLAAVSKLETFVGVLRTEADRRREGDA